MEYSKQLKILLSVMTIIILSGLTMAASLNAQRAGYHVPLYTSTLVDYNGFNDPIVISGGIITNNHISVSGANSYIHLNDGSNRMSMGLGPITDSLGRSAGSDDFYIRTRFRASSGSNNIHTVFLDAGGVRMFGRNGLPELFTILPSGNVGIRSSNPTRLLDVGGSAIIRGDLSMNSNKITNLATPTVNTDAATKGYVDTEIVGVRGYVDSEIAGVGSVDGSKWTTGTGDNIYRLDGNVGIGTSSPTLAKLLVTGSSGGSCAGTAISCDNLHIDLCDGQLGCSKQTILCGDLDMVQCTEYGCTSTYETKNCVAYDSADQSTCNLHSVQSTCEAYTSGKCYWEPFGQYVGVCSGGSKDKCEGTATQCSDISTESACGSTGGAGQRGCSWLGNSAIFSHKVGIGGTGYPQQMLHVRGDTKIDGNLQLPLKGLSFSGYCPSKSGVSASPGLISSDKTEEKWGLGCLYTGHHKTNNELSLFCPSGMMPIMAGCSTSGNVEASHPMTSGSLFGWKCRMSNPEVKTWIVCI